MKRYALDASALIALFEEREGADSVRTILHHAREGRASLVMSVVTWGEVYHTLWRRRGQRTAEDLLENLRQIVELTTVGTAEAALAASLRARFSLPYVDGFVVAAAMAHKASVVTSDSDFEKVRAQVKVRLL